jgi:hypothetical protein
MKAVKHFAFLLVLTGGWMWGLSSPCGSASLMVEKNLFASDRKPPSPEATAPAPQANKPGLTAKAVQLDGVFIRGDIKKAIMRVKGQIPGADKAKPQNPYVTVKEGEKIGDLHVVKIDTRSVSLEKDGQVEVVKLFAEGKVVPPAPPVPSAPGGSATPPGQVPPAPDAAKGQAQPAGQPTHTPPFPPGAPGGNMPGVAQAAGAPHAQGSQRALLPPGQMQNPDDDALPEEEGNIEEGGEEPSS